MASEDAEVLLLTGVIARSFYLFGKMVDRMAVNWGYNTVLQQNEY